LETMIYLSVHQDEAANKILEFKSGKWGPRTLALIAQQKKWCFRMQERISSTAGFTYTAYTLYKSLVPTTLPYKAKPNLRTKKNKRQAD
jgi:hypothetical protein